MTASMFLIGAAVGVAALKYLPALCGRAIAPTADASISKSSAGRMSNMQLTSIENSLPEQNVPTAAEVIAEHELQVLRGETATLQSQQDLGQKNRSQFNDNKAIGGQQMKIAGPLQATGETTLAYWNALNAIMMRELSMRAAPPQLTAGNAMSFVSGQSGAYQYAAAAIRKLSIAEVDPEVVALARDLAAWYEQGLANNRTAESLLGSADIAARQGSTGNNWQTAEKQHREQCLQINLRGEQLRNSLSRKYGLAFPKLQ
jgi:hypothetical protein